MKLDKAIEILEDLEHHSSLAFSPGELDSIQLSIEALKRIKESRGINWVVVTTPLPGED